MDGRRSSHGPTRNSFVINKCTIKLSFSIIPLSSHPNIKSARRFGHQITKQQQRKNDTRPIGREASADCSPSLAKEDEKARKALLRLHFSHSGRSHTPPAIIRPACSYISCLCPSLLTTRIWWAIQRNQSNMVKLRIRAKRALEINL